MKLIKLSKSLSGTAVMPVSQPLRLFSGGFERNDSLVTSGDGDLPSNSVRVRLFPLE
jgi:hypothetical protein